MTFYHKSKKVVLTLEFWRNGAKSLELGRFYNGILYPKNRFLKFVMLFFVKNLAWSRSRSKFYRDQFPDRDRDRDRDRDLEDDRDRDRSIPAIKKHLIAIAY